MSCCYNVAIKRLHLQRSHKKLATATSGRFTANLPCRCNVTPSSNVQIPSALSLGYGAIHSCSRPNSASKAYVPQSTAALSTMSGGATNQIRTNHQDRFGRSQTSKPLGVRGRKLRTLRSTQDHSQEACSVDKNTEQSGRCSTKPPSLTIRRVRLADSSVKPNSSLYEPIIRDISTSVELTEITKKYFVFDGQSRGLSDHHLASLLDDETALSFFLELPLSKAFTAESLLLIADYFTKANHPGKALDALEIAANKGANIRSSQFLIICTKLLRCARLQQQSGLKPADIISTYLEIGVQLNIRMYNVLIRNTIEAKDYETAWQIYNMLRANGVTPDDDTYTNLLRVCLKSKDRKAFKQLYEHIQQDKITVYPPLVVALILRCRHSFAPQDYNNVLEIYEQHYDMNILRAFGIGWEEYDPKRLVLPDLSQKQPPREVLHMMLKAYLHRKEGAKRARRAWRTFLFHLRQENPHALSMAETEHVWNIFLKAFSESDQLFQHRHELGKSPSWQDVIQIMSQSRRHSPHSDVRGTHKCQPSLVTWNTIVNAAARAGKEDEVRLILKIMSRLGCKPDLFTWNGIVHGLSRHQSTDYLAHTLVRMKRSVLAVDVHTVNALSFVKDRARLLERMCELEKELKEVEETQARAGKEQQGTLKL